MRLDEFGVEEPHPKSFVVEKFKLQMMPIKELLVECDPILLFVHSRVLQRRKMNSQSANDDFECTRRL